MMQRTCTIWILACMGGAALVAGCGSSAAPASGFDFERFAYPGIVPVPRAAFEEGRPTTASDNTIASGPLIEELRTGADTPSDDPVLVDWNNLMGLVSNGQDDRDVQRFYLVYDIESNPTSGQCTVTVRVIEGLPYDPARAPIATYSGTAALGEAHRDGSTITTTGQCENEAAHRAGEAILAGALFTDGWSLRPPSHVSS
jgi:hypothetical protein